MLNQLKNLKKYYKRIKKTVNYIKKNIQEIPEFGIVLGSGMEKIIREINNPIIISYDKIPYFSKTTVKGHSGELVFGKIEKKKVLILSGRFHYYENSNIYKVVYPIRVFGKLGIKKLILLNASGGVNPIFKIGDIMLIKDHINMMMQNPLIGPNLNKYGPRFVDMHEPYNIKMLKKAEKIAKANNIVIHKGVYVALQGPTFETPSEYKMIQNIGGDAVGMSTVPEVIIAKHMGINVLGISIITDLGGCLNTNLTISHEEVLEASNKSLPKVIIIIKELINKY